MATKNKSTKKSPATKKVAKAKSFRKQKEDLSFMSFKFTKQTVYWLILITYIMILMIWISHIQFETLQILNNISTY